MKTEVVYVDCKNKDQSEPYEPYGFAIYHRGKIVSLDTFSASLLSGLVSNGEFFYTWEWGSGIYRSQIVRLRIVDGSLEASESAVLSCPFVFVSAGPGGKVRVFSGVPKEFNHWEAAKDVGFVGKTNSSGFLQIIDANGKAVTPTYKW